MGNKLQVVLVDSTTTESTLSTCIKVKLDSGLYIHLQCNIIILLAQQTILGMPFLQCVNPQIDQNRHVVKFSNGNCIQVVPIAHGDLQPSLQEISAKTAVRQARQEGSASWFALIRDPSDIKNGLFPSAVGSSNPIVAALPQFQSLFDTYSDAFAEPCEPVAGQVTHRIDLLDKSSVPPRQRAYYMSPAELADAYREVDSMLERDRFSPQRAYTVLR